MTPLPQSRLDEIRAHVCVCERCGGRLVATIQEGCTATNCSWRPLPAKRERTAHELAARDLLAEVDRLLIVAATSQRALDWMRTQLERVVMTGGLDMKEIAMVVPERDRLRAALTRIDEWCHRGGVTADPWLVSVVGEALEVK